ncbi:hypothetical protein HN748_03810 [Candidatus Peregrinibacteria bacterium]|jgi:hypothetical protein|nr:hypothetical protein [Candidatus Peregrinibacteria bacterium]MBT7484067.1 hypothetical protein [Candidatus Peregrinibacteria bacterium]MBT7703335.1 hypothetical protein [Candidatus Peregrinibacteria bacterium]
MKDSPNTPIVSPTERISTPQMVSTGVHTLDPPPLERPSLGRLAKNVVLGAALGLSLAIPGNLHAERANPAPNKPLAADVIPENSMDSVPELGQAYRELRQPWDECLIESPQLLPPGIIRTYSVEDREPAGQIFASQPVKLKEKINLYWAITIPKRQAGRVEVHWEHNGQVFEEEGNYKKPHGWDTDASWGYRMHDSASFWGKDQLGEWTFVVTMAGEELGRQTFTVVPEEE